MSTPYTYTPCKDEQYKICENYAGFSAMFGGTFDTCENCKRHHKYKGLEIIYNKKVKDNYKPRGR